jgi:acetolactate synthase-1/2/3 large subunit
MKKNGAMLLVHALEQIGVRKTFGIPGIYNSAIYDFLYKSAYIEPVITCSELSAGYMADGASRSSESIGTLIIVQGAGITHAMSAIAQAFIDGIPMLVIAGSQKQAGKDYQMHALDLNKALDGIVKQKIQVKKVSEIIPTIYNAYDKAINNGPGPVFIDIPVDIQTEPNDLELIPYQKTKKELPEKADNHSAGIQLFTESETVELKMQKAVDLIAEASQPGLYTGWGAIDAYDEIKQLAELLVIPVSTNLQGISAFPNDHPLHVGVGFGNSAVPAAKNAFKNCDCLIAIGLKFSELDTASFQLPVPENLIHLNINQDTFHKNYHAKVAIAGDLKTTMKELVSLVLKKGIKPKNIPGELTESIQKDKQAYKKSWLGQPNEQLVSPGYFYNALRNYFPQDTFLVLGNGSHRFLASELFPVMEPRHFICPADLNTMGFGIPAAMGTKFLNKSKFVLAIVEEGGLMINGLEILTAQYYKLGILIFVLRDWMLEFQNQISKEKRQETDDPLQKSVNIEQFTASVHAEYFIMKNDIDISGVLTKAKGIVKSGKNVVVEVRWDNSRKSAYTSALNRGDLSRISLIDKLKILFKSKE